MNRAQFAHDFSSESDAGQAHAHAPQASDPFGPVLARSGAHHAGEAQPAPVFATPSIVPSVAHASIDFDAAVYYDDEEPPVARKKPTWMMAVSALAVIAGVSVAGMHFADTSRAEKQRVAEIEQVRQRMAELDAKRRAEEAAKPVVVAQPAPASSVAAMLAASTNSNGVSGIPTAAKPTGRAAALQAAAIKRALSQPSVSRRGKIAHRGRPAKGKRAPAAQDDLHESSNDPIYGL